MALQTENPKTDAVLTASTKAVVAAIGANTAQLKRLADLLARFVGPVSPYRFIIHQTGEKQTMGKHFIQFEADWGAVAPGQDVDHIELSVVITPAGATEPNAPVVTNYPATATAATGIEAEVGSTLAATLANVDAAGNRSVHPASLAPFVVTDQTPPADPSGFVLKQTGERVEDDAPAA